MSYKTIYLIGSVLHEMINPESITISINKLTLNLQNKKETILDFDYNFLKNLPSENIQFMIKEFNLINEISENENNTIFISDKGVTPYKGNKNI